MNLSKDELNAMISSIFPGYPEDNKLGILVDIPKQKSDDNCLWQERRRIAQSWYMTLKANNCATIITEVFLIAYPAVDLNNADLPEYAYCVNTLPESMDECKNGEKIKFETLFNEIPLFLAPTEHSTTAPLKIASKKFNFRAATMPGFCEKMIPALKIDYTKVAERVNTVKKKLDIALSAEIIFKVKNKQEYTMFFDLRFKTGHASHGRFPQKGSAGNFPSGEAYIVPYEGEESLTNGLLPVQINDDIVIFTVKENRAVTVTGYEEKDSETLKKERKHLSREPAYGNIAELGFGVLDEFGLKPINEILLDEKLGFHIGFGRSDHFGGNVGPKDFSTIKELIHLDRIYIPYTQPAINVVSVKLSYPKEHAVHKEKILVNGRLVQTPAC